jgi:hypothetical protein
MGKTAVFVLATLNQARCAPLSLPPSCPPLRSPPRSPTHTHTKHPRIPCSVLAWRACRVRPRPTTPPLICLWACFAILICVRVQIVPVDGEVSVVVLTPTRELAFQIAKEYDRFSKYLPGIKSAVLYGGECLPPPPSFGPVTHQLACLGA